MLSSLTRGLPSLVVFFISTVFLIGLYLWIRSYFTKGISNIGDVLNEEIEKELLETHTKLNV
jgi:hypothetical protein